MSERLNIRVIYSINSPDKFKIETDIKKEFIIQFMEEFLSRQVGKGEDKTPPNELEEYIIHIQLKLFGDVWYCKHNCGNLGLRDGILMDVVRRLKNKG